MPNRQNHRGPHPEDQRLFGSDRLAALRAALDDAAYLLERGYTDKSVIDVVGRRYELEARQRLALSRAMCSSSARRERGARSLPMGAISGQPVAVDGFNQIIGLEVALSGGPLFRCRDGALRDLAGLRGSYHTVDETEAAVELLGRLLGAHAPALVEIFLDAPVSNSGRLRAKIQEHAAAWPFQVGVELVRDPDSVLCDRSLVVSGDSVVIERAGSWVNLMDRAVRSIPGVWIVDLEASDAGRDD